MASPRIRRYRFLRHLAQAKGRVIFPVNENPQGLPPRERYLGGNVVTAGRRRSQTQQV